MDLASKKLPLALIGILLAILLFQILSNDERFVDPDTCEIWVKGPFGRQYLDEFDPECLN